MAVTDRTYYDMKRLHRAFALSSVLLLCATIWMFAVDHARPWKQIQRTSDRIEAETARWRKLQMLTDDFLQEQDQLRQALSESRATALSESLLAAFRDEVRRDAAARAVPAPAFDGLDARIEQARALSSAAQAARSAWQAARLAADKALLDADDAADRARGAAADEQEELCGAARELRIASDRARQAVDQALAARLQAEAAVAPYRSDVIAELQSWIHAARFREDGFRREYRLQRAELDAAKARYGLAVRDEQPPRALQPLQQEIDRRQAEVQRLGRSGDTAEEHRRRLQAIVAQLTEEEDAIRKKLGIHARESQRLDQLVETKRSTYFQFHGYLPLPGKKWLELPILDAFNSPRKIDTVWSTGLDQPSGSFGRVRRFDRCGTCHQAIQTAQSDWPSHAQLPPVATIDLALDLPRRSAGSDSATEEVLSGDVQQQLVELFGFALAPAGLLRPDAPTVQLVRPGSVAAGARVGYPSGQQLPADWLRETMLQAPTGTTDDLQLPGLLLGDVITAIDGEPVPDGDGADRRAWVAQQLVDAAVGHEAALAAGHAARTPIRLSIQRGLDQPYAGHPRLDLFVGPHSPHPAAQFGCTVCHEGQGSATAFEWASHTPNDLDARRRWKQQYGWFDNPHWDFPMYPKRFAESLCLKCHHRVVDLEPSERFPDPPAPKLLEGYRLIRTYGCYGCHEIDGFSRSGRRVAPDLRLEPDYAAPETDSARHPRSPGTLRKVGPSLRSVRAKLDLSFLVDWIRCPTRFRPTARMPRAFGLWNHLPESTQEQTLESVAVYSMAVYLRERSQPFEYLEPPAHVTPVTSDEQRQKQIERGRVEFEQRGCLACHNHADFPDIARYRDADAIELGPNLSNTAIKFAQDRNPHGPAWLYSWIKQPTRYNPRTLMPDSQLDPIDQRDGDGQVVAVTDPVADIVAYLLSRPGDGWQPAADALVELDADHQQALDQLALIHLRDDFPESTAQRYLEHGIPAAEAQSLTGPERELVVASSAGGGDASELDMIRRRVLYVARKSFLTSGCYACHDIPGLETAKPIGPSLTGWGRKDPAQLAFGHVVQYHLQQDGKRGASPVTDAPPHESLPPDFWQGLQAQSRIGFIYQKLTEPRSFDFEDTRNKKYTARLRMPQFPLTPAQREAVMTFVLGLVSDPPTEQFAYQPDARTQALIDGREVLLKYQCRSCHMLEPETWQLAFPPNTYGEPAGQPTFPFIVPPRDEAALAAARRSDRRGLRTATVHGLPAVSIDGRAAIFDEDELPLEEEEDTPFDPQRLLYGFDLWQPAVIDGWPHSVGDGSQIFAAEQLERRRGSYGGALAKYLLPRVVDRERLVNPNAKGSEGWAWLPPTLIGEGCKVQPGWLHDYLLDPQLIRPAVVMRMPKYNMSPEEARILTDYFAAVDQVLDPYPVTVERREQHLAEADARYARHLSALGEQGPIEPGTPLAGRHLADAMRMVTDSGYCVKCHRIGDFRPGGTEREQAPDLSVVYRRLRADYVRAWIAKPTSRLPYTSMPINIPYDPAAPNLGTTVPQELYHGSSVDQLDALVDLLMNYDLYARRQLRVQPMGQ